MEFYQLFELFLGLFAVTHGKFVKEGEKLVAVLPSGQSVGLALAVAAVVMVALFLLQGFGLFAMANRRKMKKKWMAFVPFANVYLMGKLAGDCAVFGRRMKNIGLYAMIAQIVAFCLGVLSLTVTAFLFGRYGGYIQSTGSSLGWMDLPAEAVWMENYYRNGDLLTGLVQIVYTAFMLILLIGLYKKYSPKNHMLLAVLILFVPFARFITVFVVRNRAPFDYEGYMRARREEFMRRNYGPYGGNPYGGNPYGQGGNPYGGNPYGQGGNPYGGNPYGQGGNSYGNPYGNSQGNQYGQQPTPPPDDPFAEFGKGTGNGTNGQGGNGSSDGDGLFD